MLGCCRDEVGGQPWGQGRGASRALGESLGLDSERSGEPLVVTEQNLYEGSPGLSAASTKLHAPFTDCDGGEMGPCVEHSQCRWG